MTIFKPFPQLPQKNFIPQDFSTQIQPLMFKYIERGNWAKLRKLLAMNAGETEQRCKEQDESGLSLLGMALGFEAPLDIIQAILEMDPVQINSRDLYGASPLHIACLNGASVESVLYLLQKREDLAFLNDKDRRIPLHHAVECLCLNEIGFNEGIHIINALVEVHPDSIRASDKHHDSPIDIVQMARMDACPASKDANRLAKLYSVLSGISVRLYKLNKAKSEEKGYDGNTKEDKGRSAISTKDNSVASSFITSFTNKETVRGMDLSTVGDTDIAPPRQQDRNTSVGNEDARKNMKATSLKKKKSKKSIIKKGSSSSSGSGKKSKEVMINKSIHWTQAVGRKAKKSEHNEFLEGKMTHKCPHWLKFRILETRKRNA